MVGQRFDGVSAGNRFCLSLAGSTCRTWPVFTDVYGDYHKGAFRYDARKRKLGFFALWAGQLEDATGSTHTNVFTLLRE